MCGGLVVGGVAMGSFSSSFLSFIASMLYIRFSCMSKRGLSLAILHTLLASGSEPT